VAEFVRLEVDAEQRVGTLRIERPPMNALSRQVWLEIGEVAQEAAERDDVGALVVWGGPKVFAAGADIKEFPTWGYRDVNDATGQVLQRSLDTLARLPKVTIAAIHGYALGGGCELALACDFRFAADNAKLGQPEILLGIIPGRRRHPAPAAPDRAGQGQGADLLRPHGRHGRGGADRPGRRGVPGRRPARGGDQGGGALRRGPLRAAPREARDRGRHGAAARPGLRLERSLFAECFTTEDAATGIASFVEHGPGRATFADR
jgi:enoyl-CoA hydratase/carnithine racemase